MLGYFIFAGACSTGLSAFRAVESRMYPDLFAISEIADRAALPRIQTDPHHFDVAAHARKPKI
jgi:hypothetical protein